MSARQLPLPEFDELSVNTLRHRIRSLTEGEIRTLSDHERTHGHRVAVLQLLDHRLDELRHGAHPTSGRDGEPVDMPRHHSSGSPVAPESPPEGRRPVRQGTRTSTGKGMEHK